MFLYFSNFWLLKIFKQTKITFRNIDTIPEFARSLLIAASSDWLPRFHASQHGLYFHTFQFPFRHCQFPPPFPSYSGQLWIMLSVLLLCEHTQSGENSFPWKCLFGYAVQHIWEQKTSGTEEKVVVRTPRNSKEYSHVGNVNIQKKLSYLEEFLVSLPIWRHLVI